MSVPSSNLRIFARRAALGASFALALPLACSDNATEPSLEGARPDGQGGSTSSSSGGDVTRDGGGSSSSGDSGNGAACTPACSTNQVCDPGTRSCVCAPGFVSDGAGGCKASLPGDPASHTQAEVCMQWRDGHTKAPQAPWSAGPAQCDPGQLTPNSITETLARTTMFRWLVGLGPVVESVAQRANDMACAAVASWNPPGTVPNPHAPPSNARCYTAAGAAGAGSSNIAWGSGHPADAIDQFMEDRGNDTTFGHRRWIMNPPLGAVGIGYYAGGGQYGNAQCLGVFDQSGIGPRPAWLAFPPPGFVPVQIATWAWSFHAPQGGSAQMTVRREDGTNLPMTRLPLTQGFGQYGTTAFRPNGWTPMAGQRYLVTVTGATTNPITYEVKPVSCN
jgi:uncharacterized protein YkwD